MIFGCNTKVLQLKPRAEEQPLDLDQEPLVRSSLWTLVMVKPTPPTETLVHTMACPGHSSSPSFPCLPERNLPTPMTLTSTH